MTKIDQSRYTMILTVTKEPSVVTLPHCQSFYGLNDEITEQNTEAFSDKDSGAREYLGASTLHTCLRNMWYRYRWYKFQIFSPRKLRIFGLGHKIEDQVIEHLRSHTLPGGKRFEMHPIDPDTFKQFSFSDFGGLFKGHCDLVIRGFVESDQWHMADVKSFKNSRFNTWRNKGVAESDPHYYDQLTMYAGLAKLTKCCIIGYNKDTSELAYERFDFDQRHFANLREKIRQVLEADEPLPRCAAQKTFYICKMCDYYNQCWDVPAPAPLKSCRSCHYFAYSQTKCDDGTNKTAFFCSNHLYVLSKRQQINACDAYTQIKET